MSEQALREDEGEEENDEPSIVDLGYCIGSECLRTHGVRVATWRGIGPCSIYVVCDECHAERLTAEERKHMVEVRGAAWVRHLGIHELHNGRPRDPTLAVEGDCADTLKNAIGAITAPSPKEERMATRARLAEAVRFLATLNEPVETRVERIVSAILAAGDKWEAGVAQDRDALRAAAEAYFGVDFSKPEAM